MSYRPQGLKTLLTLIYTRRTSGVVWYCIEFLLFKNISQSFKVQLHSYIKVEFLVSSTFWESLWIFLKLMYVDGISKKICYLRCWLKADKLANLQNKVFQARRVVCGKVASLADWADVTQHPHSTSPYSESRLRVRMWLWRLFHYVSSALQLTIASSWNLNSFTSGSCWLSTRQSTMRVSS